MSSYPSAMCLSLAALLLAAATLLAADAPDGMAGPSEGPWRRLFLDASVVEKSAGLERTFHALEKHPGNPVLKADKPWEGRGYGATVHGGTVLLDEGRLRMWYIGGFAQPTGFRVCYAESADGVTWTKPSLGLVAFEGSTDNNIVLDATVDTAARRICYTTFVSVLKRPGETGPARRYALYCYYHQNELTAEGKPGKFVSLTTRVAFSPDGLKWTFAPDESGKGLFPSGDVTQYYRDPYRGRYYATWKSSNRRGRAAGVAFSPDGLSWSKPIEGPVFVADDLDPDDTQIYGLSAFAYQGLYLGLPWIYHSRWFKYGSYTDARMYAVEKDSPCTMDAQLAWSWDLVNWTRAPGRAPFLTLGAAGACDCGMAIPAKEPVLVGDRLLLYYGGFAGAHNQAACFPGAATCLATLRLDGFCSLHAGATEGWLLTRREVMTVPRVRVNAAVRPGGTLVAELLDEANQPLAGFTRADCVPFTGDSVRHVLTWKTPQFAPGQAEGDKKVRFYLRDADLYSYLPE